MIHRPSKATRVGDCLEDILDAIRWIGRHVGDMTEVDFGADRKTQDSVIKNLTDIGEAANNTMQLDPDLRYRRPDVWEHLESAYGMRIRLTHGYRSIDAGVVWNTIVRHLPELSAVISAVIDDYRSADDL